jgi:hypothetical protein
MQFGGGDLVRLPPTILCFISQDLSSPLSSHHELEEFAHYYVIKLLIEPILGAMK